MHTIYKKTIQITVWTIIAIIAGLFVWYPLTDGDIFWHLAAGREMVLSKSFLFSDPFSYTNPGARWIDLHWLFQLTVFFIYRVLGYQGLLILKSVLFGGSVILMLKSVKRQQPSVFMVLLFLTIVYQFRYLVPMRPILYTLFFIAVFIYILEYVFRTSTIRALYILLPVQLLWTNSQGLFMLGPVIYTCYLFGELLNYTLVQSAPSLFIYKPAIQKNQNVHFIVILILLPLITILNPYGIQGVSFPFLLFSRIDPSLKNIYSGNIVENTPLLMMIGSDYAMYVYLFFSITIFAIFTSLVASAWIRFSHLFCIAAFMLLAYMAQRNIILYLFMLVPFLLWNTSHISSIWSTRLRHIKPAGSVLVSVIIVIFIIQHLQLLHSYKNPVAPFSHPIHTVSYLKEHHIQGNIFNADRYGGYLL